MRTWEIFYFLLGDPIFDPDDDYHDLFNPRDPECAEMIELRRRALLQWLDGLHKVIEVARETLQCSDNTFQKFKDQMLEAHAREHWTALQFYDRLKQLDPETARQIVTARSVNDVDPDFSFRRALEQRRAAQDTSS